LKAATPAGAVGGHGRAFLLGCGHTLHKAACGFAVQQREVATHRARQGQGGRCQLHEVAPGGHRAVDVVGQQRARAALVVRVQRLLLRGCEHRRGCGRQAQALQHITQAEGVGQARAEVAAAWQQGQRRAAASSGQHGASGRVGVDHNSA
jgi:hypothetical protein